MAAAVGARALVLVLLALAAIATGVWGQEAQEAAAAAAVDAHGRQEQEQAQAGGKGGLFGRVARMLDTGGGVDDDSGPLSWEEWEATKNEGEAVDPSRPWGSGGAELPDAWNLDTALKMVQSTLDGNPTGAFREMLTTAKDIQDAWANPTMFKYLMDQFPLFQAIKPLQVYRNMAAGDITPDNGRKAMKDFLFFVTKSMDLMEMMLDPNKLAAKVSEYSNPTDLELVRLLNLAGDTTNKDMATAEKNFYNLQKYIYKKELGDLVDLDMLGYNGVEPPFLAEYRNKAKLQAPGFYNNIIKDPMMRKYIENPFAAVEEARDIATSFSAF